MMLDVDLVQLREGFWRWFPFGVLLAAVMVGEMIWVLGNRQTAETGAALVKHAADYSNTKELGRLIYTDYVYPFELAAVLCWSPSYPPSRSPCAAARMPSRKSYRSKSRSSAQTASVSCSAVRTQGRHGKNRIRETSMLNLSLSALSGTGSRAVRHQRGGYFPDRKNVIVLLMSIELMLLAVNTNFIAFSHYLNDAAGQVFVFFILTVAAPKRLLAWRS